MELICVHINEIQCTIVCGHSLLATNSIFDQSKEAKKQLLIRDEKFVMTYA